MTPDRPARSRLQPVVAALWLALIALAFAARLALILARTTLEHDEAASYLAATGHQRAYAQAVSLPRAPVGQWVPARDWQDFITPGGGLVLGRVRADLARYDIHPPLYFWLLHAWSLLFGVAIRTGPLLNAIFDAALALALYRLARRLDRSRTAALAAVGLWALSPVAVQTTLPARPYGLFALLAVLFAWALAMNSRSRAGTIRLAVLTGAGLLTHYLFGLALIGGLLATVADRDRARLRSLVLALLVGVGLFAALHPDFADSLRRETAGGFDPDEIGDRLVTATSALLSLTIPLGAALAGPAIATALRRQATAPLAASGPRPAALAGWLALALIGGQVALLVLQLSPAHALMDYRYLGPAWPFVALLLADLLHSPPFAHRDSLLPPLLGGAGMCALLIATTAGTLTADSPGAKPDSDIRVLIDNPAAGSLLPVVIHLDPDVSVFAADQASLLADPAPWLIPLSAARGLYVSQPTYDATLAGRDAILALIDLKAYLAPLDPPPIWQADPHRDTAAVYRILPWVTSRAGPAP